MEGGKQVRKERKGATDAIPKSNQNIIDGNEVLWLVGSQSLKLNRLRWMILFERSRDDDSRA